MKSFNLPTAGDIDREPDDELFGDEIGLIGCCCCVGIDWAPGCEALFVGSGCVGCWLDTARLEVFSLELFWAAAAASCCLFK